MKKGIRYYHFQASEFILQICPEFVQFVCLKKGTKVYSETPDKIELWEKMEVEKNRISGGVFRVLFESAVNPETSK